MKYFALSAVFFLLLINFNAYSQDNPEKIKNWKTGGVGNFMFSQVTLTNWAAGGQNSVSLNTLFNTFANYKKESTTWDNMLDVAYGVIKNEGQDLRKSDDKIEFSSKFGHLAVNKWYYSALLSFKTQMAAGYKYPNDSVYISKWMAPGYLNLSLGMDYKPSDNFSLLVAPLTGKVTFVKDQALADEGNFGVEKATYDASGNRLTPGKTVRKEFGGFIKMAFKKDVMENINLQTKLELFSNYIVDPQNVDINWEMLIGMKINKYISTNISTQLIYDHDIAITDNEGKTGPRTQFKELIGIGLSYQF